MTRLSTHLGNALLLAVSCGGSPPAVEEPATGAPPSASPGSAQQTCDPGSPVSDLRAEMHDGDWGYGSIMVYARIPKPIQDLAAVLDYTRTDGKTVHLESGIVAHEARSSCGEVVLVGFDIDDFLLVDRGSVTLTDIVFEDGTEESGPFEVPFELNRIEP